ncbi:hypothetical protein BDV09DRAFT_201034 [Aspergillus tetrazonus]
MLDAAGSLGDSAREAFIVNESLGGSKTLEGKARHWSYLLNTPGGGLYEWLRLSRNGAKSTAAVLLYTSRCKEIVSFNHKFAGMSFLLLGIMIPLRARYKSIFPLVLISLHLWRCGPIQADFGDGCSLFDARNIGKAGDAGNWNHQGHVLTGGSFVSWKLVDEWQRRFGSQVQSTAGFFAIPDPNEPVQDTTMGILVPNVEARILDESSDVLSLNETGVYTCTPFVMKGYLDEATHTAQTVGEDG